MITLINNEKFPIHINLEQIKSKIQEILDYLRIPNDEVTIVFDNDKSIREINKLYAGVDKSTDVLSFSMKQENPESNNKYLGDIIISLDKVCLQSDEKNHSYEIELLTLIAHGILHLLNYDHADGASAKLMFNKQDEILHKILRIKN